MTPNVASRSTRLPALILVTSLAASGLLLTPLTATAAPVVCSNGGTLISGNICEIRYTAADTFKPTPEMFQIEALLVGAGGSGTVHYDTSLTRAGSGGEVQVISLLNTQEIEIDVATDSNSFSIVTQGQSVTQVGNGSNGSSGMAGNGAGGQALNQNDGGPGITGAEAGGPGSLFSNDHTVYGSGGGRSNVTTQTFGIPGNGAGSVDPVTLVPTAPAPHRGGGGGGLYAGPEAIPSSNLGASGQVTLRWKENREVTFFLNGHGTAIANQTVALGDTAAIPPGPTATDYTFDGWYTDTTLTTPADFTQPITSNTTFYAKWSAAVVPTPTPTETQTPEPTPTPTETQTPEPTPTPTETQTPEPTPTPEPSNEITQKPSQNTNNQNENTSPDSSSDNTSEDRDELAKTGNDISGNMIALSALATGAGALALTASKRRRKS